MHDKIAIMKILIADDEPDVQMILEKMLEEYGSCTRCSDGEEAFQAFSAGLESNEPFDLICLDISMPKLTGREALIKIRDAEKEKGAGTKGSKIIMITAHSNIDNFTTSFEEGCEAFLPKPFDKQQLLNNLRMLKLID